MCPHCHKPVAALQAFVTWYELYERAAQDPNAVSPEQLDAAFDQLISEATKTKERK